MKCVFCDRRPVAKFISGGSRAGKDSGAWEGEAGDKEKESNTREMSGESNLRGGGRCVGIKGRNVRSDAEQQNRVKERGVDCNVRLWILFSKKRTKAALQEV